MTLGLDPFRGACFHGLYNFRNGFCAAQPKQKIYMVGHSADLERRATYILENPGKIRVKHCGDSFG